MIRFVLLAAILVAVAYLLREDGRRTGLKQTIDLLDTPANVATHMACRGDLHEAIRALGPLPEPPRITVKPNREARR